MTALLPGVSGRTVPTSRLGVHVLTTESTDGAGTTDTAPVLFVHGNVSSSVFWQEAMLALPAPFRPIAMDLRGFGDTDPEPVDATRGLRDYSDDVGALLTALDVDRVHLVGWSMGGGVVLQYLLDDPSRVASVTLVAPVSPYGFGGTRGLDGTLCDPSGAGSGGGAANPEFVRRLAEGDRGEESALSPRQVLLSQYVKPPFVPEHLDAYVESMLSTRVGDDHYPGTVQTVDVWPNIAPGDRGVLNTMAPTHLRLDGLPELATKPPILWIRGSDDVIVSDTSLHDLAHLGSLGAVPGWPGPEQCPAQPMVGQTRAVLDAYAATGGRYREVVVEDAGHAPHIERPKEFVDALATHLTTASTP